MSSPPGKTRKQIQLDIKAKESAQDRIARQFASMSKDRDEIKWCLYSMSDNNSFLRCNRFPVDAMIGYLKKFFDPDKPEKG